LDWRFDLRPKTFLALGALAFHGLLLSLLLRPGVAPMDRQIVWGGALAGFSIGMVWMLG